MWEKWGGGWITIENRLIALQVPGSKAGPRVVRTLSMGKVRLSNKVVEQVVAEVAGEDVLPLVRALKNKKNVSEFKLAESIKEEINSTRNMLYRLYHANLVSFTRKKDKKKGWYIYYWTFKPRRIRFLLTSMREKRLKQLQERLEKEKDNFFFCCEEGCMRLVFEQAMDFEFKCPECGNLMNQEDNQGRVKKIEEEIKELKGEA